jgi:protein-S-isoprenylcysteine O-methyltransferase Ste14
MKIKEIIPDSYFNILLGMSILFHFIFPIKKLYSYPYNLNGILLIITGIVIVFMANSILLKKKTSVMPFEVPTVLITTGPFRFSRNPIYLGMTFILFGAAAIPGTLSPFIFPIIFVFIVNKSFIPVEERTLEKLFGEKYLAYKNKVRRWI